MTPDERRRLLAFVDERHARIAPGEPPLGLALNAETASDAATVALLAEWLEAVMATSNATADALDAVTELRAVESEVRVMRAGQSTLTERSARGFTDRQIRSEVVRLRKHLGHGPTREEAARALDTSESTLVRAMKELAMGPWPPSPPSD